MFHTLDPMYWLFAIPGLILSMIATMYVKSAFAKYSQVKSARGMTGAQAAYEMLLRSGVTDVKIEPVNGFLSDHYDPTSR
ncbi:MAG TPA: zinc metallopeptidase, partial [Lentisphaeria bacterium]|nr:zinc metallopeptidase [Lentisphaeria bacterium]